MKPPGERLRELEFGILPGHDRLWCAITLGLLAVLVALQFARLSLEKSHREAKQRTPNIVDLRHVREQSTRVKLLSMRRPEETQIVKYKNNVK